MIIAPSIPVPATGEVITSADVEAALTRASTRRRRWRRGLTACALAATLFLGGPLATHWIASPPVRFHQFDIAALEARYLDLPATDLVRTFRSLHSSGWRRLAGGHPKAPAFEDVRGMLDYVFSWVPSYAVVYPTERFYYFRTRIGDDDVWGNFRVADLARGRLMFTYFALPIRDGRCNTLELTERDGLRIGVQSEDTCDVTWMGRTVRFVVADLGRNGPKRLELLPEEEFAGHVQDESGLRFFLLFNRDTRAFYYALDEENGVSEEFESLEAGLLFGRRTEFVFLQEERSRRKLLLGAAFKNIEANNYFDGPGDQVPIGLDLRERIYQAYPSARFGEGIDAHGVMLGRPAWARYVIGPYMPYSSVADIVHRVRSVEADLPRGRFWTALTREWWWTPEFVERTRVRLQAEGKPAEMPWLTASGGK